MSLASGIKANISGMALNTALSVGANVLLARYLLAGNFGVLAFVTNSLSILVLVAGLGLEASIGYALVQKSIAKEKLAALALLVVPVVAAIVFLLAYFLPLSVGFFRADLLLPFSVLFVAGNLSVALFAPFYQAEGRYRRTAGAGVFFNAAVCLLCSAFLFWDKAHGQLKMFVLLYAGLCLLYGLALIGKPLTHVRGGVSLPAKSDWKPLLHYAFSALAANLLFLLVYRVDYWFVQAYCSENELGNYVQASKLGQLFLLVPTFIATPVFFSPNAASNNDVATTLPRITRWVFVFTLLALAVALLLGYFLFEVIYGPTFNQVFTCLLALAVGIVALSVNRIICAFWARAGLVRYNSIGNGIALTAIVSLDAVFIKPYGIVAAALISSVGYLLFLSFNLYMLKRRYGVQLLPFFRPAAGDLAILKNGLRA